MPLSFSLEDPRNVAGFCWPPSLTKTKGVRGPRKPGQRDESEAGEVLLAEGWWTCGGHGGAEQAEAQGTAGRFCEALKRARLEGLVRSPSAFLTVPMK